MPTFAGLASTFVDFLNVAIHTILYERGIYPLETFLSARKYNYAVRQNRHPRVCAWIQAATSAVETELLKGTIARVALVVFSPSSEPLERFVFDLSHFPEIPPDEIDTPFERSAGSGSAQLYVDDEIPAGDTTPDLSVNLEEQFRATMARLSTCGSELGSLPPDCTYTVVIESKRKAQPPIDRPQPWIPVEPNLQADKSVDDQKSARSSQHRKKGNDQSKYAPSPSQSHSKTLPLRAIKAGEMIFEVWAEESKSKRDALTNMSVT